MRNPRLVARCCSFVLALSAATSDGRAQLWIVTPAHPPQPIVHADLAYANGDGPPVTWLALRFSPGPVAIVAALPQQARVEPALDAWFSALDSCASPNILPPASAADCSRTAGYSHVGWAREAGMPASELELRTRADVVTALEEQGLEAPSDLPEAEHYSVWSWARTDDAQTTRTLRIVGGSAPLALSPGARFPLLVSSVTRGPVLVPDELTNDELAVTFVADRDNDYRERLRDWVDAPREPLLESRQRGPLFDWSILANTLSLPPLADSYARAAARELPDLDAVACKEQLAELRRLEAPNLAACGDAVDFGLALAAAGPEQATLGRWATSGARGFSPEAFEAGGEPRPPVLRARVFDGPACVVDPPPVIVLDPPAKSEAPPVQQGTTTTVVVQETVVVDATPAHDVSCGCSPGRDPYYDDRDSVDCSSDTSSSTSDDACSGDSSSSSRDQSCGSDSSSSSSDDSCDGGSEDTSYDGDTCTGSAAPGADRTKQAQASQSLRPRRVKTSLWSLAFAAIALPIRRRKRGQTASC